MNSKTLSKELIAHIIDFALECIILAERKLSDPSISEEEYALNIKLREEAKRIIVNLSDSDSGSKLSVIESIKSLSMGVNLYNIFEKIFNS